MIINFSIENFGSIKERQFFSFEATDSNHLSEYYIIEPINGLRLLKLGLIYGANASGKTTILKALDFLRTIALEPLEKKNDELDFNPFLFDPIYKSDNSKIDIAFVHKQKKYNYEVVFNKNAVVSEQLFIYNPNKANIFKRITDEQKKLTEIIFGSKIKINKNTEKHLTANTLWNNTVLGGFLKTNVEIQELEEVTDWFNDYLSPIIYTRSNLDSYITERINKDGLEKKIVTDILKKADFNISDILIQEEEKNIPTEFISLLENQLKNNISKETFSELKKNNKITSIKVEFEHTIGKDKYVLPFDLESEGTKRYYGFAGLLVLLIKGSEVLLIDELESSLHPDLYIHFLLSFLTNSSNSQIIATTHNRELLKNKDIFRNDIIWFTDKNESLATELYPLSGFPTDTVRNTSSIYNAYQIGKLGGTPNLNDYFIDIQD